MARTASCQRPKSPESEKGTGFGWPDTALQRPLLRLLAHLEDRHQARKLEPSQPRDGARSPTPPTIYSPAHKVTRPETNGRPQPTTAALEGRADRQEGGGRPHSPPGRAGTSPRTWSAWSWSPAAREACAASGQVWRGGQRALSCNTPPATAVPRLLLVHKEPRRLRNPPPRRTSGFAGHQRATPWLPSPARLLPPGQPGSQRGAWGGAWGRGPGAEGGAAWMCACVWTSGGRCHATQWPVRERVCHSACTSRLRAWSTGARSARLRRRKGRGQGPRAPGHHPLALRGHHAVPAKPGARVAPPRQPGQ